MTIYHQSKRPLCCHEGPDSGDHIAEYNRGINSESDLLMFTYLLWGRLAGARRWLCKCSTQLHQCWKISLTDNSYSLLGIISLKDWSLR